jgi:DNA mismatch repair protein MutL
VNCAGLLSELGFIIEPFGSKTCLVRAVPAVINGAALAESIVELLDEIGGEMDPGKRDLKAAQSLACHGAVRAGQTLDTGELAGLISQLASTSQPRTCPHGRPTMLHLSSHQLKREFGRTQ